MHVRPNPRTGSRHTVHSALSPALPHLWHKSLSTGEAIWQFRHIGTRAIVREMKYLSEDGESALTQAIPFHVVQLVDR
jgi:hypothetical protein